MIKSVFVDIDFTLTDSDRNISNENIEAINKCVKKGIKVILTSGRSRMETIARQKSIGASSFVISANGADVYDINNQKEILSEKIEKDDIHKLLRYSIDNDFQIRLIYKDKFITNKIIFPDEKHEVVPISEIEEVIEKENIIQCVICNCDIEKQKILKSYVEKSFEQLKIVNESKRLTDSNAKPTKIYYCDITSRKVSKGNAVLRTCEYFNINPKEIITIGDSENDLSMFKITPNSIVMGNATTEIKHKANYVTLSNNENGVAKVLNSLYLTLT